MEASCGVYSSWKDVCIFLISPWATEAPRRRQDLTLPNFPSSTQSLSGRQQSVEARRDGWWKSGLGGKAEFLGAITYFNLTWCRKSPNSLVLE